MGRTQLLLYYLFRLQQQGRIPDIPIYVDSPMAIDVTRLYKSFGEQHRLGAMIEEDNCNPFRHKRLHYVSSQEGSIGLNQLRGDAIIVSASGMASGGRVLHHLYHRLPQPQDAVIFVGHQAQGTRGRRLVDGEESVRMYGIDVPVRAKIYQIEGLSAHADQRELLQWAAGFVSKPKRCFLVHGEQEALETLRAQLETELGWQAQLPAYLESVALFEGL
ncbi:MBL fold metallo-hydrolase RNA specificity domain-containing protein [Nitritalea halalkaliphila]|uniref:MBL fold metallo-hydrolase RNA specificity domain-containing protein n=1 Tax=Nitritalea halalkaliphila TaxID=590849 RepID=UPI000300B8C7|nr:MBL fold metallo-hydrolase RNA specificity domain-containing protein [Nitritalea halalkaliphila]